MAYQFVLNLTTSKQRFIVIKDKGEHQNALFHSKCLKCFSPSLMLFPKLANFKDFLQTAMAVLTPRNLHIVSLHLVLLDENNISCSQNNRMPVLQINRVTDVISEEKMTAQCQSQKIKTRSLQKV